MKAHEEPREVHIKNFPVLSYSYGSFAHIIPIVNDDLFSLDALSSQETFIFLK